MRMTAVFALLCFQAMQDDAILERADKIFEEAKAAYEKARDGGSVSGFVDAGFRLEDARIKYLVLQEIGQGDKPKVAAERLRAVNQLSKLIHDGKVAISGTPAEVPPSKPAEKPGVAPPPDPIPTPVAPVAMPAVDVSKRAQVPDAAKQKDAEKLVKELFKDQYAKKSPADRKALAGALLTQSAKSLDDPVALWVLCREAQDIAIQTGDIKVVLEAVETMARFFDVDSMAMKGVALTSVGKTAKTPEEFGQLAPAVLKLIDELVAADQYNDAEKTAALGVQYARKANDQNLLGRLTTRAKDVAEAKSLFQSMKASLETLAKAPDDPAANLEMGKYVSLVKGNWDLGIRFLVKGSDPTLKALAEKELAMPSQAGDRVAIADGWWDLAEKEKSPLRKSQLQAHAKMHYESAVSDAPALVRAEIEKRLDALEQANPSGTIDLLKLIDVKRDTVAGDWSLEGHSLSCGPGVTFTRLMIPYQPAEEYDLTLVVERKDGQESFYVGLARGTSQWFVTLDGWVSTISGIGMVNGKDVNTNETTVNGRVLTINRASTIVCSVRKDGITVTVDEKKLLSYKGGFDKLSNPAWLKVPNPRALWVGSNFCRYTITKMVLTTVSGQGRKLQ